MVLSCPELGGPSFLPLSGGRAPPAGRLWSSTACPRLGSGLTKCPALECPHSPGCVHQLPCCGTERASGFREQNKGAHPGLRLERNIPVQVDAYWLPRVLSLCGRCGVPRILLDQGPVAAGLVAGGSACLFSEKEGIMLASPVCVGALVGTGQHGQSQVPMGGVRCRAQNRYEELPSQGWGSQGPPVPPCPTASTVPHCVEAVIACF